MFRGCSASWLRQIAIFALFVWAPFTQASTICISGGCSEAPPLGGGGEVISGELFLPDAPSIPVIDPKIRLVAQTLIYTGTSPFTLVSDQTIILDSSVFQVATSYGTSVSIPTNSSFAASSVNLALDNTLPLPTYLDSIAVVEGEQQIVTDNEPFQLAYPNNPILLIMTNPVSFSLSSTQDIYMVDSSRLFTVPAAVPAPGALGLLISGLLSLCSMKMRRKI